MAWIMHIVLVENLHNALSIPEARRDRVDSSRHSYLVLHMDFDREGPNPIVHLASIAAAQLINYYTKRE